MADNEKQPLITLRDITKDFNVGGGKKLRAVNHISINIYEGETLGIVGESGCGKSTLGRVIMGIYPPTKGELLYRGKPIDLHRSGDRFEHAKKAQLIFQDPYASLDSRMTVGSIISEGMEIHKMYDKEKRQQRVYELLETVGLNKEHANRFPHEFSGGQRQRIGIARALAIEPEFIVCDEPISALDVSIQSQVINLLKELQDELKLTYMFIAHDLNIVKYISDRIAVMYLGNVVELADSDEIYAHTLHPYSQALLDSVPIPDPDMEKQKGRMALQGDVPSPITLRSGCAFASRCPHVTDKCRETRPELKEVRPNHFVACHLMDNEEQAK
ncbi:MAG: ATP-binding cassette domain-containing protein [Oscillospiraceae bacterium]